MTRRQIVAALNKIANELDTNNLYQEANIVTRVMKRIALDENDEYNKDDYGICPDCDEPLDEDGACHDCGYGEDDKEDDKPKKKNNTDDKPKYKNNRSRLISKPPKSK
jgi:transcription initiation factor IIE alpha subunit